MKMFAFGFTLMIVSTVAIQIAHAASMKHPIENVPMKPSKQTENINDVPDQCKHLTYCTVKPKDYPEEKFNEMLKDYKPMPQPSMVIELNNRQGDPDDEDNCESDVTYEPLYKVREKRYDPWRTVIQAQGQDFVQRVRLEKCRNPDAPCFKVFSPVPDYVTFCKQKVNTWEVLVAKGNNETETIKVELPVCCSCHYRPIDFVTRFGKANKRK